MKTKENSKQKYRSLAISPEVYKKLKEFIKTYPEKNKKMTVIDTVEGFIKEGIKKYEKK